MLRLRKAALVAAALLAPSIAVAQSSPGWFVPKQQAAQSSAAKSAPSGHRARPQPMAAPEPGPTEADAGQAGQAGPAGPPPVLPLPPVPPLSELPKGSAPPTAVVGVLSVPDIMRASTAAEQVQKILGARRDKLNQDVQKEQLVWRDTQVSIQDSKNLTPDQARARVRSLQQRVQNAQQDFKNRQRIIQEAAQVALGQIERELVQVIRQVASSHGMNLVLHQEQVALNVQGFDISQQVANQLNSILPSVFIPANGVDPEQLARDGTFPTTAGSLTVADQSGARPAGAPATAATKH